MKTTEQNKEKWLSEKMEIEKELYSLFSCDDHITIADIGACDCLSSIKYARMFPYASIKAFEPRKDNVEEAMENILRRNLNNRISLFQVCLGSIEGSVELYESSGQANGCEGWDTGNKSSSILEPDRHTIIHPWCKFESKNRYQMRTLDSYEFSIDYIHIDVQGYEMEVFKGAQKTLENVKAVWCEASRVELYKGQPLKDDVIGHMNQMGFSVQVDTCYYEFGDCLFVRRA